MVQLPDIRLMTEKVFYAKAAQQDGVLSDYVQRVQSLETLGGLAPGDVSDATMTDIAANPVTRFGALLGSLFRRKDAGSLNILDFGVARGTSLSQTAAIKSALDANPGRAFYFPPGDYRLDTGLIITKGNSIRLDDDARLYAGAAMDTLITFFKDTADGKFYAEDKSFTGGLLDGALLAKRLLSIKQVIRYTITRTTLRDGINRGIVLEGGPGAEVFIYDARLYNTTTQNVIDNVAIEAFMGDCHIRDVVMRDWTVGYKGDGINKLDRVHPWISPDNATLQQMTARYPTSIAFDITGNMDIVSCYADSMRTAYKLRAKPNGVFTATPLLLNCEAIWPSGGITDALMNTYGATALDNTDGVGVVCDRMFVSGHSTGTVKPKLISGTTKNVIVRNLKNHGSMANDAVDYLSGVKQGISVFTPTIYGASGAGAHAYTAQVGEMVTQGDQTTYRVQINGTLDATTAFSGVLRVGGLPIPAGTSSVSSGTAAIGYGPNLDATAVVIFGQATPYVSLTKYISATQGVQESQASDHRGRTIQLLFNVTVRHFAAS